MCALMPSFVWVVKKQQMVIQNNESDSAIFLRVWPQHGKDGLTLSHMPPICWLLSKSPCASIIWLCGWGAEFPTKVIWRPAVF